MNKDIKTLILKEIEDSKTFIGDFIGFSVKNKFYLYNKKSGLFYSYKYKINDAIRVQTKDFLSFAHIVKEDVFPFCKKCTCLIEDNQLKDLEYLKPLLSLRGGKNGCSYIGLTFYKEGYKVTFNAQTIVGVLKFGLDEMLNTFGSGSEYVIDHINNEKTYNAWNNIQILTRRDNRWGK